MTTDAAPRHRHRQWITRVAMLAIAAASFMVLRDELPDLGEVWAVAIQAEPAWLVIVVIAEILSMGAFARLQRRLLRSGGLRISLRRVFAVTYAGNALSTTLPAGPAVSVVFTFRQFRKSGASSQLATAVILVGGVVTSAAYSLIALTALLAEPRSRAPAAVVLAGVIALAGVLWMARARVAGPARRAVGKVIRHPRVAPHAEQLRTGRRLLRLSVADWGALVVFALLNWVFDILALIAATHAVGIEVTPYGVALAYFVAQAAGSLLPLLPGGLGAVESAMAGALVAMGAGLIPAGAAVGVYRLVSYWAVVAVGWLAWLGLRESPWRIPGLTRARAMRALSAFGSGVVTAAALPYIACAVVRPSDRPHTS